MCKTRKKRAKALHHIIKHDHALLIALYLVVVVGTFALASLEG